jgi:hypothetical protein
MEGCSSGHCNASRKSEKIYAEAGGYFFCNLRSLRWYSSTRMRPMKPITANVVNAMSMFDIVVYLHSINKKSCNKEYTYTNKSYPKGIFRKLVRYEIPDNCNTHNEFTYIITILGEVVYLFLIHHDDIMRATYAP